MLCQLVPGKWAFYAVRVPRLAALSPASFRPHLAVTPLPLTRSYPHGMLSLMKVNLLQGTCTPTLTPMPGVHNRMQRTALRAAATRRENKELKTDAPSGHGLAAALAPA